MSRLLRLSLPRLAYRTGGGAGAYDGVSVSGGWRRAGDHCARHHPVAYDTVMAARTLVERELIVEALAGLLFVRNWIGRGARLDEVIDTGAATRRITQWTWKPVGEPALAELRPRARAWELARYRAYQACLAGHTIGKTFGQAVSFLTLIGANAA